MINQKIHEKFSYYDIFFPKNVKTGFFFPESGKFVTFKTETIIKIMFLPKNRQIFSYYLIDLPES